MGKDPFLVPKPFLFAKLKQTHELQQVKGQALDTWACEQRLDKVMRTPLTVWITTSCGKVLKRWAYQTTLLPPEKSVCRSRSNREQIRNQTRNNRLVPYWEGSTSRLYIVTLLI